MSDLPEVQRALRNTAGVAHARIAWPEPSGPAHLTISFVDDADEPAITREILDVLRRVGHVDLETLEVLVEDPVVAAGVQRADRPAFESLSIDRGQLDASVGVVLHWGDRAVTGRADGLASHRQSARTAAEATLSALAEIVPATVRTQLEWVEVSDRSADRPAVAQAAVTVLSHDGEDVYMGSAPVRGDVREAAVRATLDAVNRRLGRLLVAEGAVESVG